MKRFIWNKNFNEFSNKNLKLATSQKNLYRALINGYKYIRFIRWFLRIF